MRLVSIDIDRRWRIPTRSENTGFRLFLYAYSHVVGLGGALQIWPSSKAIGAILYANNSWAIEIFDRHSTYSGYHESLLKSFAVEASEAQIRGISRANPNPRMLLDKLWSATSTSQKRIGVGELISGRSSRYKHCALEWLGSCMSISATGFVSQLYGGHYNVP